MLVTAVYGQVTREWVQRFNGSDNRFDIAQGLHLDASSNAYVVGSTASAGSSVDIVVIKYSPAGAILWTYLFNGFGNSVDQPYASCIDDAGNCYVAGFTADSNSVIKIVTIKINASGQEMWSRVFLPPASSQGLGNCILIDSDNNIVTAGSIKRTNGSFRLTLLKYSPAGDLLDTAFFNVTSSSSEAPVSVCADNASNIYVLGTTNAVSGYDDILLLKYNAAFNLLWQHTLSGTAVASDQPKQILYTGDNKLAVLAAVNNLSTGYDYGMYRFDTNAALIMQYVYNGTGNNQDIPFAMAIDAANNIHVTGSSRNADTLGSEDFFTIKIDPTGTLLWGKRYNGVGMGIDYGISIAVDNTGNVFAGGTAESHDYHVQYALLKYGSTGDLLWLEEYSAIENHEDFIYTVAVNNNRDIFVTGISFDSLSDYDIATIKYSEPIGITPISNIIPKQHSLGQNYPNPFNPATNIGFQTRHFGFVSIKIYDISGKETAVLVNEYLNAGVYNVGFDASHLAGGVYFYRMSINSDYNGVFTETKKMILLK
jgi:hypothetical protein